MPHACNQPEAGRANEQDTQQNQRHDLTKDKAYLQAQLADMLDAMTAESFDEEKISSLLAALDKVDPLPEENACDPEKHYAALLKKYAARSKTPAFAPANTEHTSSRKQRRFAASKILPIAAAFLIVLGLTSQAFGFNLFESFIRWTAEIFQLDSGGAQYASLGTNPLEEYESRSYDSVEALLKDFQVSGPLLPTEVPEGMEVTKVEAGNIRSGVRFFVNWRKDSEYINLKLGQDPSNNQMIEKDLAGVESVRVNGIDYYFAMDKSTVKVVWANGNFEGRLTSNLSRKQVEAVIKSIK